MVIITSLIAILVFSAATQGWFINRLRWYEIIAFLIISMSLFRPDYILDKIKPKFNTQTLQASQVKSLTFENSREVHFKITRRTGYGDRYKLFVIEKDSFKENFSLEDYGINLIYKNDKLSVASVKWDSLAKKQGIEFGDVITELKVENLNRPNQALVYPFALVFLLFFGYTNSKSGKLSPN